MSGRAGRRLVLLAAIAASVRVGFAEPVFAAPAVGAGRRVLGSLQTTGRVEGSIDGGDQWLRLYPGAAVLDGMQIRVPGEGSAGLTLAGGDQVVFGEYSAGGVTDGEVLRVRLERGRLMLGLRPASKLVTEAGRGVVRTVPGKPMAVQAVVRRDASRTVLETKEGVLELRAAGTETGTVVEKGYQAAVGPTGPASGAILSSAAPPTERDPRAAAGVLGIAGLTPVAAMAIGGGIAAAGIGVGAAAGSGAFDGDGSSSPDTVAAGGREGSPFRPIRR
jgi:hypothetical protein